MKKFSVKELLIPGLILFVICLGTTLLLALTNEATQGRITALAEQKAESARKQVLKNAESFSDELTAELDGIEYIYYEGLDAQGDKVGYVFTTVTKGYGGDVKIMSGIDITGEVTGLEILQLTETAGLGMKAYDDYFLKQFFGQSGSISVVKNNAGEHQIQALTGATITSVAVAGAVNRALALYAQVSGTAEEPTPGLPTVVRFGEPFAVELDGNTYECRKGFNDADEVVAYDFVTAAQGHRDLIKVRTAVDINGVVTGVELLEINDTPANSDGAKAAGFLNQYIGKSGTIGVVTSDPGDNEVQALTGATRTTNGFTEAVNIALKLYESVAGGDNNG